MPLAEERCKQSSFCLPVEAAVSVFSFTCAVTAKGKGNGVRWIFVAWRRPMVLALARTRATKDLGIDLATAGDATRIGEGGPSLPIER